MLVRIQPEVSAGVSVARGKSVSRVPRYRTKIVDRRVNDILHRSSRESMGGIPGCWFKSSRGE